MRFTPNKIIGMFIGAYATLVVFRALQGQPFSLIVNPTEVMLLAVANIGAGIAVDALT